MKLRQSEFLFFDCQTTGMRPSVGHLLELGFARGRASDEKLDAHSHIVQLPEGHSIPRRVTEITGLKQLDLELGLEISQLWNELEKFLKDPPSHAIIHYASFEKAFLLDLFARAGGRSELPFEMLCSYQLAKTLIPTLPSSNIRAAAGFFGASVPSIQRAGPHVEGTWRIWQGLVSELEKRGIETWEQLTDWKKEKPKKALKRYEYRLESNKRLSLPDSPGVYRMLSKSGQVLYVGKATSLKSRVNSYFRGIKGRDTFKLERLAQVWDLQTTVCETPLEAAILESDEIKRHDPPYNVVLKKGHRQLVFYSHDFERVSLEQSREFPMGPFRQNGWIERLRLLMQSLRQCKFLQVFYLELPPDELHAGFAVFCGQYSVRQSDFKNVRSLLALGHWILRNYVEEDNVSPEPNEEEVEKLENGEPLEPVDEIPLESGDKTPLTPEEIAGKFERLLLRAARDYQRAKKMTQFLNADIYLELKSGERELHFRNGKLKQNNAEQDSSTETFTPYDIETFDRISILMSELNKYKHRVVALKS